MNTRQRQHAEHSRLMRGGRTTTKPGAKSTEAKKPDDKKGGLALLEDLDLEALTKPMDDLKTIEVKEPEDAIKALMDVRAYALELKKRGELQGEALVKLATGMKRADDMRIEQERRIKLMRPAFADADGAADLSRLPARAKKSLYRYLMTTPPQFLGYTGALRQAGAIPDYMASFYRSRGASEATQARVYELQALNDIVLLTDTILGANKEIAYSQMPRRERIKRLRVYKDFKALSEEVRESAMDTATAGEGLEWIPTILSSQLRTLINAELQLAGFFDWQTMPGPKWDLPVEGADAIAYKIVEALDDVAAAGAKPVASVPGTRKMSLVAVKAMARVVLSVEFTEDSVIDAVPHVLVRVARALARAREMAIVNGQPSGTIDTGDVPGATDARMLWDGLRKQAKVSAITETNFGSVAPTVALLAQMRGVLKEYGQNPADLVWITGYSGAVWLTTVTSASTNFAWWANTYGPDNVMRTGTMFSVAGSPVVVSQFVREDLTLAGGIYDGVTTTGTILLLANRTCFQGGERRAARLRVLEELLAQTDQIVVLGSLRADFKKVDYAGTQRYVALGRAILSY